MLQKIKQAVLFQCILHVHIYGGQFRSYHAVKSNLYANESCIKIEKTESTLICFTKCINFPKSHSLFSYNENLQSCVCCSASVANSVESLGWKAYTTRVCKDGYVSYNYTDFQICLTYVPDLVRYSQARAHCEADGADLIRMDTTLKFDLFKEFLAPFDNGQIEVWIQSVKIGQEWRFHDGTLFPSIHSMSLSNAAMEIHLRARSQKSYDFYDEFESNLHSYVCEYYN